MTSDGRREVGAGRWEALQLPQTGGWEEGFHSASPSFLHPSAAVAPPPPSPLPPPGSIVSAPSPAAPHAQHTRSLLHRRARHDRARTMPHATIADRHRLSPARDGSPAAEDRDSGAG